MGSEVKHCSPGSGLLFWMILDHLSEHQFPLLKSGDVNSPGGWPDQ